MLVLKYFYHRKDLTKFQVSVEHVTLSFSLLLSSLKLVIVTFMEPH